MKRISSRWLVYGGLLALTTEASAHPGHASGGESSFVDGMLHPVLGLDHLAAMVAVGLWGATLGGKLKWQLPVVFPMVMALGGALGTRGVPLPMVEVWIALSAMVIGCAVAFRWRPQTWAAWLVTGLFAIFHGHAHGAELPEAADPMVYAAGFVLATGLLHLAGVGIGELDRVKGGRSVVRAMGGIIALSGIWFLARGVTG